jgi:hypothetical protein
MILFLAFEVKEAAHLIQIFLFCRGLGATS